ncbi:MAG: hypothetical protein JSR59_16915 [Proteobacteria bacterium]|nr:hypothetical protein [Pseudomonadota bacterium]
MGAVGTVGTVVGLLDKKGIFSLFGISAPVVVWIAAVAGAVITFAIVFDFYRLRCLANPQTLMACSAGVIQRVAPSFGSATDELFPFTAMHDRIDVVVKCIYWFLVENNAAFVQCNDDADTSPFLRGYYKNDKVCGAGLGSTIGAGVGAVAGIFLGVLAGGAIASLACGPVALLCLILAVVVALVVAAVSVLVGALIGGQIGKAAASGGPPVADDGNVLSVSDFVTTQGGLLTSGDDDGARVYWFVTSTTLHGRSGALSPFSHRDPDDNLPVDACPAVTP